MEGTKFGGKEMEGERSGVLTLTTEEQEIVQAELLALLPALSGERRKAYQALADAVDKGEIPPDLQPLLEGLIRLALETGRARRLYRAEGERVLTDLFGRTPAGQNLTRGLREVNKALSILKGQTLTGVRVGIRTLGHFTVTLEVGNGTSVTLAVRPDGVTIDSITVGAGEAKSG